MAGGQDTLINVFRVDSTRSEPSHTLLGHSENVCSLDATAGGTIISGSWDKLVHSLIDSYTHMTNSASIEQREFGRTLTLYMN